MFIKVCFTLAHESWERRGKPGGHRRRTVQVLPGPNYWNQHHWAGEGGLGVRDPSAAAGRLVSSRHFRKDPKSKIANPKFFISLSKPALAFRRTPVDLPWRLPLYRSMPRDRLPTAILPRAITRHPS